ncbi:MAG TPA: glucuronate isomerase, partial [Pirellulales bacterium]|nr:glucuronate isomerase [Pirellulales bacterium]
MPLALRQRLFGELDALALIDPHTHINPHAPASETLADVLGYHYYAELAHSAGLPKAAIEEPGLDPKEKVRRLVAALAPLENTIQYSWLIEMVQKLFQVHAERLTLDNWEFVYDSAAARMSQPDWPEQVLQRSRLEGVFLTNDFDDPLTGFDTGLYVPCLRTDDLVFHLARRDVQERLERASGQSLRSAGTLRQAISRLFDHFASNGAKACAVSLSPDFAPARVEQADADRSLSGVLGQGEAADAGQRRTLSNFVFWTLAEHC